MLRDMHVKGPATWGLLVLAASLLPAAELPSCSQGARSFLPCELKLDWNEGEVPAGTSPYKGELANVEFRSPQHKTYLIRAFWDGGHALRVRFSPTEAGDWTYHITSAIKRFNDQESTFNVAESGSPGFVGVANLRHWWTTNKQPHLWLAAEAPFLAIDQSSLESWLDARKHDGFTHIRGILLNSTAKLKPVTEDQQPNFAYFADLDSRVLAAATRGFTLDLILADKEFASSPAWTDFEKRDPLLRYVVARYGALNVAWQGVQEYEDIPDSRALLKSIGESLKNYDSFHHPLSTDARDTSSPLLGDGWMNYIIEASASPALGAVEHQFTQAPAVHVVQASKVDEFRHELWNCTTNGEYPSVSYQALQNPANVKAVQVWSRVMSDTRHWELEPYFDVDGARAIGLTEVEYLAYAQTPGIVEITLPKHKYNPVWVDPSSGEEIPLKDYKGEVFSQQTPNNAHDWILQVPREGHKESMLRSYRFESEDPPIQEPELDPARIPFEIVDPPGDTINSAIPSLYGIKLTRKNRATRSMQYVWWGEVVAGSEGARVLAIGPSGTLTIPKALLNQPSSTLNLRLQAINANGKAYEVNHVYRLRSVIVLALDVTSEFGSLALRIEGKTAAALMLDSTEGFAHLIFPAIQELLDGVGVKLREVNCFASASGPGAFTGVRVGLSAVKGLAEATGAAAAGISNLRALSSFGTGDRRAVVLDARRGEIFGAVYGPDLEIISAEVVTKWPLWLEALPASEYEFVSVSGLAFAPDAGGNAIRSHAFAGGSAVSG